MNRPLLAFASLLSFAVAIAAQGKEAKKAEALDFEKQIWPILETNCLECHSKAAPGPDGKVKKPKGGVVLDSKDAITAGKKGKLVVAKKSGESMLYASISLAADHEDRMPPAKKGEPLPKEQQDLIKQWIDEGADFGKWTAKKAEKKDGETPAGKDGKGDKKEQGGL
ncbi:MAG: hypothetical protein FJ301_13565 [Planctomycetes bacterium]|nr:hypothetical protein [Planctomycetota bacterium]